MNGGDTLLSGASGQIRAVIVDDEPLARERLRLLLDREKDIKLVGEGTTGREAIALVETQTPDLMFLDVAMPDLDGVAAISAVPPATRPAVIFVTAYNDYAPRAFELDALDYLLKPFSAERFELSLARARRRFGQARASGDGGQLSVQSRWSQKAGRFEPVVVKSGDRFLFFSMDEIDWIEASGNYVCVHVGTERYLIRESMKGMEARLDSRFLRGHRGSIVNGDRIRLIGAGKDGHLCIVLRDGTRLPAGRQIESRLRAWLGT